MRYYFLLQYRILQRRIIDFGLPPIVGMLLAVLLFIVLSALLFDKTDYAAWIYAIIGLGLIARLGDRHRTELLRITFSKKQFYVVRAIENGLLALTFLPGLLIDQQYLIAPGFLLAGLGLIWWRPGTGWNITLPTPFGRRPFEMIIGFRKMWLLYGLMYFITFKAIQVDNFNLGVFALAGIFLLSLAHFTKPEPVFYVWNFACKPSQFLMDKIKVAVSQVSLLSLPVLISLCFFYPAEWYFMIAILLIGNLLLITMILGKYSAFPGEMSLPQALLFSLGLGLPPLLLLIIPLFYRRALKRLNLILE